MPFGGFPPANMKFKTNLSALTGNEILLDVARLVSGTLGGRLIVLAALPLVTRLYSPADFALLAVYLGLVSMISVVACLRFDIAIPVATDEEDAVHLLVLALGFAGGIAALGFFVVLMFPKGVTQLLGQPGLEPWLWLAPLGIFLAAAYSALQFWTTRARRFGSIAVTRVTQAAAGVGTMLALGWAGIAPLGLLLGNMLNIGAGSLRLALDTLRHDRIAMTRFRRQDLTRTFHTYHHYPLYSTSEALANIAGLQVPVLVIAAHAGAEAGLLLLAQQIMTAPMTLLGSSISQVYVSRAPGELRAGRLAEFTAGILLRLLQIGIAPLILVGLVAPYASPLIFGVEWTRAGEIVALMVPWIILQFLTSPVSMVMFVVDKQKSMLLLTLSGAILRIGAVGFAIIAGGDHIIAALVSSSALYYGGCLAVFSKAAGIRFKGKFLGLTLALLTILIAYIIFLFIQYS